MRTATCRAPGWPRRAAHLGCAAALALLATLQPCRPTTIGAREALGAATAPMRELLHPATVGGDYPRLANYNGLLDPSDVPAYLHDAVVIAQDGAAAHGDAARRLESANPRALVLVYQRTLQVDYPLIHQLYGTDIYPGWWLLRGGSALARSIDARQTAIPVANAALFRPYDDVLVDGESMHVLAIQGRTLIVQRHFYSRAASHRAGARIAAHYSYRVDLKNTILEGKWENRRPWSFNLSTLCPRDPLGRTWDDFLAGHMAEMVRRHHWSGVFFDNTDELPRDSSVDVNNDNQPDGGVVNGHNVWHDGEVYLLSWTHALAPGSTIMDNGTLDAGLASSGREMEGFSLQDGLYPSAMSDYAYWQRHDAPPGLDLVNPDSGHSPRFDLAAMRFGLASALLGDGYYAYDEGWHRHGVVWNFDEYDNGAGTALLADIGPRDNTIPVRRAALFRAGDIALIGREQVRVVDTAAGTLVVRRGIDHSRPTSHLQGSVVATVAQIDAGSGYLGQALGPATALLPAPAGPNVIRNGDFRHDDRGWSIFMVGKVGHLGHQVVPTGFLHPWESGQVDPTAVQSGLRDERGYALDVAWRPLRKASSISLVQSGIAVTPRTPYTLSFWATGVPGTGVPVVLTGLRPRGQAPRYTAYVVTLHRGWYRYTLPYTSQSGVRTVAIGLQFGRAYGRSIVAGITLQRGQSLLFMRRFTHGLVLVNQAESAALVRLPGRYWHLRGDQDPAVNTGQPVGSVWMPPRSGMLLLNAPPPA